MPALLRTVVIIGGGFSGTVLAADLLRRPPQGPTRLVLIERSSSVGRGVAYAQKSFPFLLNVPASRMSATSSQPSQFLEFVQRRMPKASGEDFLPRALYGDYLEELLMAAQLESPRNVRLDIVKGEVVNVRRIERHLPLQVELDDGRRFTADDVVLALGNPKPAMLPASSSVAGHAAYIQDPWSAQIQYAPSQKILLIGTGLTAADVINHASADAQRTPTIYALSRHGGVPPRQTAFRPDAFKGDGNALLLAASTSLRGLTSSVRLLAREAEACGGDWREAITFVRHMAPTIWQRLPERDRVRFLRHLRAHWDIHRHRLPPEMTKRIESLRKTGRLQIHAGRIQSFAARGAQIEATWQARGRREQVRETFDFVVNCTGPDYAIARSAEPLWRNLVQCGLCTPDALGLGLRTGPKGAVIDADGWPGPHLFYVGPMLRADYWEATAAQELRGHIEELAVLLGTQRD